MHLPLAVIIVTLGTVLAYSQSPRNFEVAYSNSPPLIAEIRLPEKTVGKPVGKSTLDPALSGILVSLMSKMVTECHHPMSRVVNGTRYDDKRKLAEDVNATFIAPAIMSGSWLAFTQVEFQRELHYLPVLESPGK